MVPTRPSAGTVVHTEAQTPPSVGPPSLAMYIRQRRLHTNTCVCARARVCCGVEPALAQMVSCESAGLSTSGAVRANVPSPTTMLARDAGGRARESASARPSVRTGSEAEPLAASVPVVSTYTTASGCRSAKSAGARVGWTVARLFESRRCRQSNEAAGISARRMASWNGEDTGRPSFAGPARANRRMRSAHS